MTELDSLPVIYDVEVKLSPGLRVCDLDALIKQRFGQESRMVSYTTEKGRLWVRLIAPLAKVQEYQAGGEEVLGWIK